MVIEVTGDGDLRVMVVLPARHPDVASEWLTEADSASLEFGKKSVTILKVVAPTPDDVERVVLHFQPDLVVVFNDYKPTWVPEHLVRYSDIRTVLLMGCFTRGTAGHARITFNARQVFGLTRGVDWKTMIAVLDRFLQECVRGDPAEHKFRDAVYAAAGIEGYKHFRAMTYPGPRVVSCRIDPPATRVRSEMKRSMQHERPWSVVNACPDHPDTRAMSLAQERASPPATSESEQSVYWNTRFPDDRTVDTTKQIVVGVPFRLETALEASCRGAVSRMVPYGKLSSNDSVTFDIRGDGVGLRVDASEGFVERVRSQPQRSRRRKGGIRFCVELQAESPGEVGLHLQLNINGAAVLQQHLMLVAVPLLTSSLIGKTSRDAGEDSATPAVASPIGFNGFPVQPALVRVEIDINQSDCRLRIEVDGRMERVVCPGGRDVVVDDTIRIRNELVQLSEAYAKNTDPVNPLDLKESGEFLLKFAQMGARIHELFFGNPNDEAVKEEVKRCGRVIAQKGRNGHAPRMQILAEHVPFPWGLVYDGLSYGSSLDATDPSRIRYETVPKRVEDVDVLRFWGYRFRIDRTFSGLLRTLSSRSLKKACVQPCFNPHIDDEQSVKVVARQRDFFERLCSPVQARKPVESDADLQTYFQSTAAEPCDLLYFFCHAECAQSINAVFFNVARPPAAQAAISLEPAKRITIDDMRKLRMKPLEGNPLVFMNACCSAVGDRAYQSLFLTHFVNTWAARGFVGTDWKVPSVFADAFGRLVLDSFLAKGQSIGDAFGRATRNVLDRKNPFPLIYALYVRPELTARGA